MSYELRSGRDAVHWMMRQHKEHTEGWKGYCQRSTRMAIGVPAWAPSAIVAWSKIPDKHRCECGDPTHANEGEVLYYDIGHYGHAALAGYHKDVCWSVDYEKQGQIGRADRQFKHWRGIKFLGHSAWTPFGTVETSPSK